MKFKKFLRQVKLQIISMDFGFVRLYYKFFFTPKKNTLQFAIDELAKNKKDFFFIQIGGNDGYSKDPIFKFVKKYRWRGIIVEPQKIVFENQLKKIYKIERQIFLENVAIGKKPGIKKLYKISISESRWATGLASFNKKTIEYQIKRNYVAGRAKREGIKLPRNTSDYITYENVCCATLGNIVEKYNINRLNLLQIDTEGYDFEIIKTIDFDKLRPEMISYENQHLSNKDKEMCEQLLRSQNYMIKNIGRDTLAF